MKAIFAFLLAVSFSMAAPAPPEIIVNNKTMECSQFMAGDECFSCKIPEGWESPGYDNLTCPEGYSEASAPRNCSAFKNARCCSEGHSGAMGDCGSMIVNHLARQCRFLSENESAMPGWASKPEGTDAWGCPEGYIWPEDVSGCIIPAAMLGALIIGACIGPDARRVGES